MRLINCHTRRFEEFFGQQVPPYAILSHTWDDHEISFKEYFIESVCRRHSKAVVKINQACDQAKRDQYGYMWIDSCCIDKSSSAELTEAINSMYKWYQNARRCYVYLSDVGPERGSGSLVLESVKTRFQRLYDKQVDRSRWFTRGWTLQELLAPSDVGFYDKHWRYLGSRFELAGHLSNITKIPVAVLNRVTPSYGNYSLAQKMSWAAGRLTTREEDTAYCLFGLFNVNLPLLYGEGGERAFIRLQEEIMKESNDLTLFAWQASSPADYRGLLARSPQEFSRAGNISSITHVSQNPEFAITNKGLRIETPLLRGPGSTIFMPLNSSISSDTSPDFAVWGIHLVEHWGQIYRDLPHQLAQPPQGATWTSELIYITKNIEICKMPWKWHASVLGPPAARSEAPVRKPVEVSQYCAGSVYERWESVWQGDGRDLAFAASF